MPLKCHRDGEPIYSFAVESESQWRDLKNENSASKNLRMPCCDAGVMLRVSKLGTRHFAHARRGPCSIAPETAEHLLAKRVIVEGIGRTPWTADTERAGASPELGPWIADVMASKGSSMVSFEVQWSKQSETETRRRQERYEAAGVRGLWFFRQHDFPVDKDVPAFYLAYDAATSRFLVRLPSYAYNPEWMSARDKNDDRYWQQSIELSSFVEGALTHRLRFAPALGATLPVDVLTAETTCWRCKKDTRVVIELVFAASRRFPGCADIPLSIYELSESLPDGDAVVASMLPAELMRRHGVGAVKWRRSKIEGGAYLSNGCFHCDALQGRFFEHEFAHEAEKTFEVGRVFERAWGQRLEDASDEIHRWWFDESPAA